MDIPVVLEEDMGVLLFYSVVETVVVLVGTVDREAG